MGQPLRVLLVDDEPDFLETLSYRLTTQGHQVSLATNGAEALEHIQRHAPHMVFLDLVMPHMDGLETLRRIREAKCSVPVVLLATDEHDEETLNAFRELGIVGVFAKQGAAADLNRLLEAARKAG